MAGTFERARGAHAGPAYLFAAAGTGLIRPAGEEGFEAIELPTRRVAAIPAVSPDWEIEDTVGLKLIRITPRWPEIVAEATA